MFLTNGMICFNAKENSYISNLRLKLNEIAIQFGKLGKEYSEPMRRAKNALADAVIEYPAKYSYDKLACARDLLPAVFVIINNYSALAKQGEARKAEWLKAIKNGNKWLWRKMESCQSKAATLKESPK